MALPRLVFLVIALIVLTVLVGIFLGQHLYYICLNQTTNERHKTKVLVTQSFSKPNCENDHDIAKSKCDKNNVPNKQWKVNRTKKDITRNYRPYGRGLINNILEVFLPFQFLLKMKLKER